MKYSRFVMCNFAGGSVYVLSVGPAAYGAGKVAAGEQDWESLVALVGGLTIAAGCAVLAARYYRHRRTRLLANRGGAGGASAREASAGEASA